jgi:hypothetical protein
VENVPSPQPRRPSQKDIPGTCAPIFLVDHENCDDCQPEYADAGIGGMWTCIHVSFVIRTFFIFHSACMDQSAFLQHPELADLPALHWRAKNEVVCARLYIDLAV